MTNKQMQIQNCINELNRLCSELIQAYHNGERMGFMGDYVTKEQNPRKRAMLRSVLLCNTHPVEDTCYAW